VDRVTFRITGRGQLITAFKHADKQQFPFIVEVRDVTRTDEQNRLMWPMLTAFSEQAKLSGRTLIKDQWKSVFLQALGQPQDMLPTLDESTWFAAGLRSSKLTKPEFSALIDLMLAEAAQRGVDLKGIGDDEAT
jgi:hypothetical protein